MKARMATAAALAGASAPLGASVHPEGINFSLFSKSATSIELLLFDDVNATRPAKTIALDPHRNRTHHYWHTFVPDLGPGQIYAYRAHGPFAPDRGLRFDGEKVLLDPYGLAIAIPDAYDREAARRPGDNTAFAMKSVVADPGRYDWEGDAPLGRPCVETIIYEMHVRGFTIRHPAVAPRERGTFAALASPAVIDYLIGLGVTAVELLPVHASVTERTVADRGLANYWGYSTIGYFAPDPRFLPNGAIAEVKTAVKRLHEAGIEVILDVVYNHTGEGNQLGPTLSFRGIDNLSYYRLQTDRRLYQDVTGTGNTLNLDHPRVMQMVFDSLRYWVEEMHVDGFRFDLCTTLGREHGDYSQGAAFFDAMRQDPVMAQTKLIAEPWDVGPFGYQLGNFPPGWAEWNGQYRDGVRRFWKGDKGLVAEMASRLAGSSDIFGYRGRRPWASINFVTAHDGYTLQDLVSYEKKHNEANGEDNRDGHDANFSYNGGVEGPTDDPAIIAFRDRQKRNFMATLLLSLGVPMLLAGDEFGHTQHGNNNAYCQDNEISWLDWENIRPEDAALRDFVRYLIRFLRTHRVFSRPRFFRGEMLSEAGLKDITWVTPAGVEATGEDWANPVAQSLGYLLCGAAGEFYTRGGQRDIDESFLVMMNAYHGDLDFCFPNLPTPLVWEALVDTAEPTGRAEPGRLWKPGEAYKLRAHSFALFINRAPNPAPMQGLHGGVAASAIAADEDGCDCSLPEPAAPAAEGA